VALRDMVSYPEFRTSGAGHEPFPGDRIAVSGIFVLMRTTLASFFLSSGLGTVQGAVATCVHSGAGAVQRAVATCPHEVRPQRYGSGSASECARSFVPAVWYVPTPECAQAATARFAVPKGGIRRGAFLLS
jgi:hypothetical protein